MACATFAGVPLERELGSMDADHHQTVLAVPLVPRLYIRNRTQAVDAAVGPEVDHDDLAFQLLAGQPALLNHGPRPVSAGSSPSTGKTSSPILLVRAEVSPIGWLAPSLRARPVSKLAVCALDSFDNTRVSSPRAMAATPTSTSTPRA